MKIAIDGRALMNPPAGIGNFLINAINQFVSEDSSLTLYLLVNRDVHAEVHNRLVKSNQIIIIKKPLKLFSRYGLIWFIIKPYFILKKIKPDIFWGPANVLPIFLPSNVRTLLTVHDLVVKEQPNSMMIFERIYSRLFFNRSIKKANMLWTVSNFTKNEITKQYKDLRNKYITVAQCFDSKIYRKIDITVQQKHDILGKFLINEKFLLFVGTIEPRKNLKFLLSLMPELSKQGFSLLIVGAKGWGDTGIERIINKPDYPTGNIKFSGFIETKELVEIYNIASLLVLPSVYEGFGLPALEAMSCGCPVVAADNSGLHEVVANGGLLVKGWKKTDWVEGILHVYHNRDEYKKKGLTKALEYSSDIKMSNVLKRI